MISEQELVEVFRILRHDWLNDLQLIKANISLNRIDRIEGIIQRIVEDAHQESNLTQLKADHLTSFLLLQKTLNKDYDIQIHVEPLSLNLSKKDDEVTKDLEILLKCIQSLAPESTLDLDLYSVDNRFFCKCEWINNGIEETRFNATLDALKFPGDGRLESCFNQDEIEMSLSWALD